jgi:hypothetical protein
MDIPPPQSVVRRVTRQIDEMASSDAKKSPFFSPAARSSDPAFREKFNLAIRNPDCIVKQLHDVFRATLHWRIGGCFRDRLNIVFLCASHRRQG